MPKVSAPPLGPTTPAGIAAVQAGVVAGSIQAGLVPSVGLVASRPPAASAALSGSGANASKAAPAGHATPELAGSDFLVIDEPRPQTVGILYARDGDGKTHFACAHCPEPVILIGLDGRGERTARHVMTQTGRKIFYLDAKTPGNAIQMTHEQAQQTASDALSKVSRNYDWAVDKGIKEWGKGTLVIDTTTELRDLVRLAVRGRVDRPMPGKGEKGDFGKSDAVINRTLKYFTDRARDGNLNLLLLARSKPIYEGREDTGRITFDTDKIFSQAADWIVGLHKIAGLGGVGGFGAMQMLGGAPGTGAAVAELARPTFEIQVTNPKCAFGETGKVYRQAEWEADQEAAGNPFVYAMTRLLPGSRPADWR